jgi:hypothetical protein
LQGFAVNKEVIAGSITPNQYLVLSIDFSDAASKSDITLAEIELNQAINDAVENFYTRYAFCLKEGTVKDLIDRYIVKTNGISSLRKCSTLVNGKVLNNADNRLLTGVKGVSDFILLFAIIFLLPLTMEFILSRFIS